MPSSDISTTPVLPYGTLQRGYHCHCGNICYCCPLPLHFLEVPLVKKPPTWYVQPHSSVFSFIFLEILKLMDCHFPGSQTDEEQTASTRHTAILLARRQSAYLFEMETAMSIQEADRRQYTKPRRGTYAESFRYPVFIPGHPCDTMVHAILSLLS